MKESNTACSLLSATTVPPLSPIMTTTTSSSEGVTTTSFNERTPLLGDNATHSSVPTSVDEQVFDTVAEVEEASDAIKKALPKRMVAFSLFAVLSGLFIAAIDSTLVIALIGPISSAFNASDRVFWVNTAYLLSMSAFSPIFGRLSDIFGRKPCLLTAVVLFGIGTLLCTVAPSMEVLVLARAIQGLGAAGVQPSAAVVINDLIPLRSRGMYQAIAQLIYSMGFALGGPVGGLLNDHYGWRTAFTMQLPPIALAFALLSVYLVIPKLPKTTEERQRRAHFQDKPLRTVLWSRLDPIGAVLFIASIVAMLLSLSLLSAYDLSWSDARVCGGLILGTALLFGFLFVEIKVAEEPLVPLRIMRQKSLASIWVLYILLSISTGAMLFYLPFYFIAIMEQSSTQIGLHYLSISVATMTASFAAGAVMKRTGRYWKFAVMLSVLSLVTPFYLLTWTDTHQPPAWAQNLALVPYAFGGSALNTIMLVALFAIAGQQYVASAAGLLYVFRALGTIAGLAIMGSVIQKILLTELSRTITGEHAKETIDLIRKNVKAVASLPPKDKLAAVQAYSKALHVVFILTTAFSVLTVVAVMMVEERPLDGKTTSSTAAHTEPDSPADDEA